MGRGWVHIVQVEAKQRAQMGRMKQIADSRDEYRQYIRTNHAKKLQQAEDYRQALSAKVNQDKQIFYRRTVLISRIRCYSAQLF